MALFALQKFWSTVGIAYFYIKALKVVRGVEVHTAANAAERTSEASKQGTASGRAVCVLPLQWK